MITCTRKLHFDSAHRVVNHESKCKMLHGHRYVVEVSFIANNGLDELGRVIDFSVVKEKLKTWIDENWDHNTILWEKDVSLGGLIEKELSQKIFYLPHNPTAENMAVYLLEEICPKLFAGENVKCIKIKLSETPNCYAEVVGS